MHVCCAGVNLLPEINFSFQLPRTTPSIYMVNRVGDKLWSCLSPLFIVNWHVLIINTEFVTFITTARIFSLEVFLQVIVCPSVLSIIYSTRRGKIKMWTLLSAFMRMYAIRRPFKFTVCPQLSYLCSDTVQLSFLQQ